MTTRRLVPPAALAALLLALGCTASLEAPREKAEAPTEEKAKGDQPHVAPMPRIKKTNAELLIGKWRVVERNGRQIPKDWVYLDTFTRDGLLHRFADDPGGPDREPRPQMWGGTYSVEGTKVLIQLTLKDGKRLNGVGTIVEISESQFVFTTRFEEKGERPIVTRYTYKREPEKQ